MMGWVGGEMCESESRTCCLFRIGGRHSLGGDLGLTLDSVLNGKTCLMTILDSRITIPFIKVGAAGKGVALLLDTLPWMREWEEKSQVNYDSDCFESVHQCCRFTLTRDLTD